MAAASACTCSVRCRSWDSCYNAADEGFVHVEQIDACQQFTVRETSAGGDHRDGSSGGERNDQALRGDTANTGIDVASWEHHEIACANGAPCKDEVLTDREMINGQELAGEIETKVVVAHRQQQSVREDVPHGDVINTNLDNTTADDETTDCYADVLTPGNIAVECLHIALESVVAPLQTVCSSADGQTIVGAMDPDAECVAPSTDYPSVQMYDSCISEWAAYNETPLLLKHHLTQLGVFDHDLHHNKLKHTTSMLTMPDLDAFWEWFLFIINVMILSLSLPAGFVFGMVPRVGLWRCVQPICYAVPLVFVGPWAVAYERSLIAWSLKTWSMWAACSLPLAILIRYFSSDSLNSFGCFILLLVVASIPVTTMPIPLVALKLGNYRLKYKQQILGIAAVLYSQQFGVAVSIFFLVTDALFIAPSQLLGVRICRPMLAFLVKRFYYAVMLKAMSRHPSMNFKVLYFVMFHNYAAAFVASTAAKSRSWNAFFYFVTVDTAIKSLGWYCFCMSGTECMQRHGALQFIHAVLTKGKPQPPPGFQKLRYRSLEMCLSSVCFLSTLVGMLLIYFCLIRWVKDIEIFKPLVDFWFPLHDDSALFLGLMLLRECFVESFDDWLAARRTGHRFRLIFINWLRQDSSVGWGTLLAVSLSTSFAPIILNLFAYELAHIKTLG